MPDQPQVEVLRVAAALMRRERGAHEFYRTVADWLESTAHDVEHVHSSIYNLTSTTVARAFKVARTYIGEHDAEQTPA